MQSHFEYVRDVFLYQLEQNKRNNVPQPEIRPIAANPDIGPMHFDFDWEKDRKTLQSEGRRYFFNLEKSYRFSCDHCGMLIRNEVEVGGIFGIPELVQIAFVESFAQSGVVRAAEGESRLAEAACGLDRRGPTEGYFGGKGASEDGEGVSE